MSETKDCSFSSVKEILESGSGESASTGTVSASLNKREKFTMAKLKSISGLFRILLIEASQEDTDFMTGILRQALPQAHTVTCVKTTEHAMKELSANTYDVALVDCSMPEDKGFGSMGSIHNMAPKLPVILLTAHKDETRAFEAIAQGAQDYLFKEKLDAAMIKRAIQYAILRKQFEGVLAVRAHFDGLTGLTNRVLFESRLDIALEKQKRHGGNIGILFIDLDRFKQVNDTLGHAAGDMLLKKVANRLQQALRSTDTVARFGGDEFAVLLENLPDGAHCRIVAENTIRLMEEPFVISDRPFDIGVSIGIAICTEKQTLSRETLLTQADSAMYEAKSCTGNVYRMYKAAQKEKVSA